MSNPELTSPILTALKAVSQWLDRQSIPYTIIGGIALSLLTEPRATKDIDVTIWAEHVSVDHILRSASDFDLSSRIENPIEFATRARILLFIHRTTNVGVDLSLGALPFEKEMIDNSKLLKAGVIQVRVPTPEDLIISKAVPMRPVDLADIDKLLTYYPHVNFNRIRKLVGEFQELLDRPEYIAKLEEVLRRHAPDKRDV